MSSEGFVFPSPQWAEAYCKALNDNPEYREAGKGWKWDVALVAVNIPDNVTSAVARILGLPDPRTLGVTVRGGAIKLRLRDGTCQGSEFILDLGENIPSALQSASLPGNVRIGPVDADYVLEADYKLWKDIILGKADVTAALLSRKIRLKKGSFLTLIQYSSAAIKMANTSLKVPTKFVD
ncbi:SCP2 sterol-binding domain-containing protein [Vulcanisaeta thermophila]|uniref:SCP2 sterol-binding domain-containing protein n=1 Tax=Vulcanisaeta thermophila TaxID=867917 RepID=UPI0008533A59|nr:Fis family transcriptional regulator [Vulcanisaeta thermophila]